MILNIHTFIYTHAFKLYVQYIYIYLFIFTYTDLHKHTHNHTYVHSIYSHSTGWYRADATYQDFQLKGFISLAAELGTFIQLHVDLATFSDPSPS